jgi:uncharacterized membrane protein YGL010W
MEQQSDCIAVASLVLAVGGTWYMTRYDVVAGLLAGLLLRLLSFSLLFGAVYEHGSCEGWFFDSPHCESVRL